jgi:hypothetical protein
MKFITPLVISFSLLAFAAHAADDAKNKQTQSKPSMSQGAKSAGASSAFDRADTDKDGKLSRTEFEMAMQKRGGGASTGKSASGGASTSTPSSKTAK